MNLRSITDVGHLTVTVHEAEGLYAADLGGKSDPYCVLQLINTRVQVGTLQLVRVCAIMIKRFLLMYRPILTTRPSTQNGTKHFIFQYET